MDDSFNQSMDENKDIFDKIFSDDFTDESVLMDLSTNEELPQIILNYDNYVNRCKPNIDSNLYFDFIFGLSNLMNKLSLIEDPITDVWVKSSKQTDNCILSTIFRVLPNCYPELCSPKFVDLTKFDQNL